MSDQPVGVSQPALTRWAAVVWLGGNWWRSARRLSSRQRWTCRGCAEANTGVERGRQGPQPKSHRRASCCTRPAAGART